MKSEQIKEITDRAAEQLVAALEAGQSEALSAYLKAIGRFHRYSLHNVLLIASQKPNASYVAGFRTWNELGRFVRKGEKGIMILAPIVRRKTESEEEVHEGISRSIAGFRAAFVFDISQTDGKELPQIGVVEGDPREYREKLLRFAAEQNISVEYSVYLHGAVEYYTDQNLTTEVQRLKPQLVTLLTPLLRDHPLIVIGYRGAEPSVMTHLLAGQADSANRFAHGIFWCSISPTLHSLVADLNHCISPNLQFVLIPGFDEVMEAISHHCESLPKKAWSPRKSLPAERLPFDMTPLPEATMDELDSQKIREQLAVYCERMKIELPTPLTSDWIEQQLCSLDLAVRCNGMLIPTIAGYLLFGVNPAKRVPSAFIEVTETDSQRRESTETSGCKKTRLTPSSRTSTGHLF